MRRACLSALAAAAGALALAGPGAQAAPGHVGGRVVVQDALFEQPVDARGRPAGPRVRIAPAARHVHTARARGVTGPTMRSSSASGCKTVWATRIGRSAIFGTVLWKYTQEKQFCWSYPRITSIKVSAYPCCTDPTWFFRGTIGSAGWYLQWAGSSMGGHYSFRQGLFEQEVLGKVIDSAQPWVKLWVYGDGSWTYDTGV